MYLGVRAQYFECYTVHMFWNRFFLPSFLVLVLVAVLHWFGSVSDLYSTTDWYDFPMHFLGGMWVALSTLWISYTSYGTFLKKYVSVRNLILFTFVFGFAWEILELLMHFTTIHDVGYAWDTTHDLIMDTLGAFVVTRIYKKSFSTIEGEALTKKIQ